MRRIDKIIVHCSATPGNMNIGAKEIDAWHKERGWRGIGYHYVITRNGFVEPGRSESEVGAHCKGHNSNSIGICWVGGADGEDNRTPEQIGAIRALVSILKLKYPNATLHGHREFSNKACPSFNIHTEL